MSGATDTELMSGGLRKKERSHQSQGQNILGLRKENQAEHKECTNVHINSLLSSECCAWGEERYRTDCPVMDLPWPQTEWTLWQEMGNDFYSVG